MPNPTRKCGVLFSIVVIISLVFVIVVCLAVILTSDEKQSKLIENEPFYLNGAVAADNGKCSDVGVSILKKNGTAVDSAIATLFCIGATNIHSSGIGGGLFMVVYIKKTKSSRFYNGREKAPINASRDMYVNNTADSEKGPKAVGVPGEVKAMHIAWKAHGKLQWKQLVEPAINICKNGFLIHKALYLAMKRKKKELYDDPGFRKLFFRQNGSMLGLGDNLVNPELGKTLDEIAKDPNTFYNGKLATAIANDIQRLGGIITEDDLRNCIVSPKNALEVTLDEKYKIKTSDPPSSGAVLTMILKILKGFKFSPQDIKTEDKQVLTYHRFVEAFKFAYAYRALLGDPEYESGVAKVVDNMTSDVFTESLRHKISDNMIHNVSYYGGFYSNWEDKGTTHLSVVSKDGDAVAVSATINTFFGSKIRSPSLGIVYNNEMDDFSTPGLVNAFGVHPSPRNYIKPGKRMMSSMSPTIFLDKLGQVRLVVGASGGTRITTGVAQVVANYLWFGKSLKDAVTSPRLHHQLVPTYIRVEKNELYRIDQSILDSLARLGHTYKFFSSTSVVQAVAVDQMGGIHAISDPRKFGRAAGY